MAMTCGCCHCLAIGRPTFHRVHVRSYSGEDFSRQQVCAYSTNESGTFKSSQTFPDPNGGKWQSPEMEESSPNGVETARNLLSRARRKMMAVPTPTALCPTRQTLALFQTPHNGSQQPNPRCRYDVARMGASWLCRFLAVHATNDCPCELGIRAEEVKIWQIQGQSR
jgi:hypothetical protein